MRMLITGGAGFVGSHLAEVLLAEGHEVYVIDDLSTGSRDNLIHLERNESFRRRLFVTIDSVLNPTPMTELVGTCDQVFHLAAAVGVRTILEQPLQSMKTNLGGTESVLALCARFKKKVLITSTSEVYGKRDHAPLQETDDICYGPSSRSRWSYAASKLMDEFMGIAYGRSMGLPVVMVRLFNTVGPRQTGRYGMVLPRFVSQALRNEPITVYGDGRQSRTFTHVADVVKALCLLMRSPNAEGEVVNVGGSEEIQIRDLAALIIARASSRSEIQYLPYDTVFPEDFEDMPRRVPCVEKLRQLTGYAPTQRTNEIVDDVIHYGRTNPSFLGHFKESQAA